MAFRRMRRLKGNLGTEQPTQWIAVDTETRLIDGSHKLRLGVAIFWVYKKGKQSRREVFHFTTPFQWWIWIQTKVDRKRSTVVVCHNAPFDLTIVDFWFRLECGTVQVKYASFDSPPFIVESRIGRSRVVWVDSRNWFRWSLSTIGDMLGTPKLAMPDADAKDADWAIYCERDTAIVEQLMLSLLRFVKEYDLGVFKFTAASQAFQAYRHRMALKEKPDYVSDMGSEVNNRVPSTSVLPVIHRDEPALQLERESYYGGYVSCFRLGRVEGPIYSLDINSMYPDLYTRHDYPLRLIDVCKQPTADTLVRLMADHLVIARVRVNAELGEYPYRTDSRTLWARGKFWTTICQPEIARCIAEHSLCEVEEASVYERGPLLRHFGLTFLSMRAKFRESGEVVYESLAKLMGNALHGKFGQKSAHWTIKHDEDTCRQWGQWVTIDADTREVQRFRAVGGIIQSCKERGESAQSFPAIPAFVSSYARESLRRLIKVAGDENVYYCCVDGIHTNQAGYDQLVISGCVDDTQPGRLRLVEVASNAEYRGIGHYYLEGQRHVSGIPDRATERIDGCWEWPRFTSLCDTLSRGPDDGIQVKRTVVRLSCLYRHGVVGRTGTVRPFVIGVDELPE